MTVPAAPPPPLPRLPRLTGRTLDNGLVVGVARRRGVPMAELRLWVPAPAAGAGDQARNVLLARTMLAGTADRDDLDLAWAVQAIGGSLRVSADVDGITVRASALAGHLGTLAELVGEVLTGATYPAARVANRRERLRRELVIQRSNPATIASDALARRRYGRHPYGLGSVAPGRLARVGPAALRRRHSGAVLPDGASLFVVGDAPPGRGASVIAEALAGWQGSRSGSPPDAARHRVAPTVQVVHRPGAVQTNIRLGGPALHRDDPDYPALALAVLAFGGYFASRLVANLREDKGYTYAPRATIDHHAAASDLTVAADVASEVTGPAFLEMQYELGRMLTDPPAGAELESARRYRIGGLGTSLQTQAGLAGQLARLAVSGLGLEWLRGHLAALTRIDGAAVRAAARRCLAPGGLMPVVVGDADQIVPQLEGLAEVEVAR